MYLQSYIQSYLIVVIIVGGERKNQITSVPKNCLIISSFFSFVIYRIEYLIISFSKRVMALIAFRWGNQVVYRFLTPIWLNISSSCVAE